MSILKEDVQTAERLQKLPIFPAPRSEKEEKYLREILEYEFNNLEEPGMIHKFSYGDAKNKQTITFFHGGNYKVPRFIARHVESKGTPIYEHKPDGSGAMKLRQMGTKQRFQMKQLFTM